MTRPVTPQPTWQMWIYLMAKNFINWLIYSVFLNALPDAMKRAFVLSTLHGRLKDVYRSQDLETFDKLNALFSLTDGTVALELPTRYLGHSIWTDEDIAMAQEAVHCKDANLREVSNTLVKNLPQWVRYSRGKSLPCMEVERLLFLQSTAKL